MPNFKGTSNISERSPSEYINANLISYIDYGLLEIQAYNNVQRPQSGIYPGDFSLLTHVRDMRFSSGQVWESQYKNFVYETGLGAIPISGVYVNNVFIPKNSGYYIDHKNGRVIFDTPISTSSSVSMNYSWKFADVNDGYNIPWLSRIDKYNNQIEKNLPSGEYRDRTVQLPTIAVETPPIVEQKRYELGSFSRRTFVESKVHILAKTPAIAKRLSDIIIDQNENCFRLFDADKIVRSGVYPLNPNGSVNPSGLSYPELISQYELTTGKIEDTDLDTFQKLDDNLFYSVVNVTTSFVLFKA